MLSPRQCGNVLGVSGDYIVGEIREGRLAARVRHHANNRCRYRIDPRDFMVYAREYWPSKLPAVQRARTIAGIVVGAGSRLDRVEAMAKAIDALNNPSSSATRAERAAYRRLARRADDRRLTPAEKIAAVQAVFSFFGVTNEEP